MYSSATTLWAGLFPIARYSGSLLLCSIDIPVFNESSVDPDFGAYELGLHCLPITLLRVSSLKCDKRIGYTSLIFLQFYMGYNFCDFPITA